MCPFSKDINLVKPFCSGCSYSLNSRCFYQDMQDAARDAYSMVAAGIIRKKTYGNLTHSSGDKNIFIPNDIRQLDDKRH